MSSMFGGGFKAPKCKTLLRLAMARIKLLRNKRDIQVKQMRKDIAQLLSSGQEPSARIRVEHIAREQNVMAAYDIVELFCELVIVRLPIIESQKVCPIDLKEAVCSLIFAAPRCADLPELLQIRSLFSSKYGKEFVAAAAELRPDCGVNRRIIEKLSVRAPSGEMKLKLLTEIAEEHNVNWDPADSEAQLLKQPEDLLDGPKKFFGSSQGSVSGAEPSVPQPPEVAAYQQRTPSVNTPVAPAPQAPSPPIPPPQPAPQPAPTVSGPQARSVPSAAQTVSGPQARSPPSAPPAGSVSRSRGGPPSSSDSEEDSPAPEKRQFIPFAGPLPTDGTAATKSGQLPQRRESVESNFVTSRRLEPNVENDKHPEYDDVTAAVTAAAQNADRAVAAARRAAELAKTHNRRSESLSRSSDLKSTSSEEEVEEEDEEIDQRAAGERGLDQGSGSKSTAPRHHDHVFSGSSRSSSERREESFRRNTSDTGEAGLFRDSNQEDSSSFSGWKNSKDHPETRPEPPPPRADPEHESFWRSGDQGLWQSTSLKPERRDSFGSFSNRGETTQDSFFRRGFDGSDRDEAENIFAKLPKDTSAYKAATPKLFSNNDSSSGLFNRSNSEERSVRTSHEAPFYDSKSNFATPKFDDDADEDPLYGKQQSTFTSDASFRDYDHPRSYFGSGNRTSDLSFKDSESQRSKFGSNSSSKLTMEDYWKSSPYFNRDDKDSTLEDFDSSGKEGKSRSNSFTKPDTRFDEAPSQAPVPDGSGTFSDGSSLYSRGDQEESSKAPPEGPSAPIPVKSRRTRNGSSSRERLESGGSGGNSVGGGLPPPPGKRSSFGESKELSRSPDYYGAINPDHSAGGHSFEESAPFPPKTSLAFYNSMPRGGGGASAPVERKSSSGSTGTLDRKSSPSTSVLDRKTSPSASGLERRDSPSATGLERKNSPSSPALERKDSPSLHPNLPDVDDLTARFGALKERGRR